jgi:hypothetical protein
MSSGSQRFSLLSPIPHPAISFLHYAAMAPPLARIACLWLLIATTCLAAETGYQK